MRRFMMIALLAIGCREPLTNAEIVAETKFCEDHGMMANHYTMGFGLETVRVECALKRYCEDTK